MTRKIYDILQMIGASILVCLGFSYCFYKYSLISGIFQSVRFNIRLDTINEITICCLCMELCEKHDIVI